MSDAVTTGTSVRALRGYRYRGRLMRMTIWRNDKDKTSVRYRAREQCSSVNANSFSKPFVSPFSFNRDVVDRPLFAQNYRSAYYGRRRRWRGFDRRRRIAQRDLNRRTTTVAVLSRKNVWRPSTPRRRILPWTRLRLRRRRTNSPFVIIAARTIISIRENGLPNNRRRLPICCMTNYGALIESTKRVSRNGDYSHLNNCSFKLYVNNYHKHVFKNINI